MLNPQFKVSESQIQSIIIRLLLILENQGKLFVQRTANVGVYDAKIKQHRSLPPGTKKGFPDILVLIKGEMIGLEVKTSTGRQSKEQKEMEEMLKKHGGYYYVVRSLDDAKDVLEKFGLNLGGI